MLLFWLRSCCGGGVCAGACSESFYRLHCWNKLCAVLIEICALLVHGFTHQLDRLCC
ncbi:hypothetical protein SynROS8604_01293 [Synechococcus sp. ROS8604]|nr:hypothetical protein SynROS8604_01293 [Synechococcus sp. ROS8604]